MHSGLRPVRLGLGPDPLTHRLGTTLSKDLLVARHLADACGRDAGDGLGTGQLAPLQGRQAQRFAAALNVAATGMATDTMGRKELLPPPWGPSQQLRAPGRSGPSARQQQQDRDRQTGEPLDKTKHRPVAGSAPIFAAEPQKRGWRQRRRMDPLRCGQEP